MTACSVIPQGFANDPEQECAHPDKPAKPYTDQKVGAFITEQSAAIDVCRALLGHDQTRSE